MLYNVHDMALLSLKFLMILNAFRPTMCILGKCCYLDFQKHIREEITEISNDRKEFHRIIEPQNSLGQKGPLKITCSNPHFF